MLELLINISIDEYFFIFFSLLTIVSSFLAINSGDTRSSIIHFLISALSVSGIVFLVSESILAIVISGIYISIASLFIILSDNKKTKPLLKSEYFIIGFTIFLLLFMIYAKSSRIIDKNSTIDTGHYSGIAAITLFMTVIFIYVIFGVITIMKRK